MNISTSLCAAAQSLQHVYTDFSFAAFSKFIQYLNCTANSLASARSGGVPENACSRDPIIPFTCSIYITKTQLVLVLHLAIAMNYEETGGSVPLLACRIRSISSGVWASSSSSLASRISARSIGSSILSVSSVPCAFTDNYVHVVKFLLCLEEKMVESGTNNILCPPQIISQNSIRLIHPSAQFPRKVYHAVSPRAVLVWM